MKRSLTTILFTTWMVQTTMAAGGYAPKVGELHHEFVLPSAVDGTPVGLSQFRGKKVLLIHFASW